MSIGQGNVQVQQKNVPGGGGPPGPPFLPSSAAEGLTVDPLTGAIVLGSEFGALIPATISVNRIIDTQGTNGLFLSDAGMQDLQLQPYNVGLINNITPSGASIFADAATAGIGLSIDLSQPGTNPPIISLLNSNLLADRFNIDSPLQALQLYNEGTQRGIILYENGHILIGTAFNSDPNQLLQVGDVPVATFLDFPNAFVQMGDISGAGNAALITIDDNSPSHIQIQAELIDINSTGNTTMQMDEIGITTNRITFQNQFPFATGNSVGVVKDINTGELFQTNQGYEGLYIVALGDVLTFESGILTSIV